MTEERLRPEDSAKAISQSQPHEILRRKFKSKPKDILENIAENSQDLRSFAKKVDEINDHMVLDLETEFLLNKFTCPNDHPLTVKTCSCHPTDLAQKNMILACSEGCDYDQLRVLDCGKTSCKIYDR